MPSLRPLPYTLLLPAEYRAESYLLTFFPHPYHILLSLPAGRLHPEGSKGSWELRAGFAHRLRKHKGRDCFLTSLHDATLQAS